jgi:hypothetical protein
MAADGVQGLRSAGDPRHEPSATSRRHLWRTVPTHRQGRQCTRRPSRAACLQRLRGRVQAKTRRRPVLFAGLQAEGLSATADGARRLNRHPSSRLIPACRNSGSVLRRRLRISGPIRRSISQRRLPGSHSPLAHPRIEIARTAHRDHGAEGAELCRPDARRQVRHFRFTTDARLADIRTNTVSRRGISQFRCHESTITRFASSMPPLVARAARASG